MESSDFYCPGLLEHCLILLSNQNNSIDLNYSLSDDSVMNEYTTDHQRSKEGFNKRDLQNKREVKQVRAPWSCLRFQQEA